MNAAEQSRERAPLDEPVARKLTTEDLVEAFHLAHAVWTLHGAGIFASLDQPRTADDAAALHKLDAKMLRGVLAYVAERTDLLEHSDGTFAATASYSRGSRFLLDLYAGAYGPAALRLGRILAEPSFGAACVDREMHARTFCQKGPVPPSWLGSVIEQLEWNQVLDVGCGTAALLVELAGRNAEFSGWGLDANRAMCRAARARVRDAAAGGRVTIVEGDARELERLSPRILESIRTVTARHVANEMFGADGSGAVEWLTGMRRALPGRPLLIEDYYGVLGTENAQRHLPTMLHDYVQHISGQGVPPSTLAEWEQVYDAAGCRLIHVSEEQSSTRFIHIVVLTEMRD
jgi:SAM-dependent methyltransferase